MSTTPPPAPLVAWPWWRDLAERLGRQALQAAIPVLAVIQAATGHITVSAVLVALAGAEVIPLLKALLQAVAGVQPPSGTTLWVVLVDRAVPAAAGTLLGFLPDSWLGLLSMNWADDLTAAAAAGILAIITAYVTPPAGPVTRQLAAARSTLRSLRTQAGRYGQ